MNLSLKGVFPSLVTPFRPDGAVDLDSLKQLATRILEAGAQGLVLFDRMAESGELTSEEFLTVQRAASWPGGREVPVIVAVQEADSRAALVRARQAVDEGAAALMLAPVRGHAPFHRMNMELLHSMLKAVPVPVLLDYQPAAPEQPADPAADGLLDSLADTVHFRVAAPPIGPVISALREGSRNGAAILSGMGGRHAPDALERGAAGVNPAASLTRLFVDVHDYCSHDAVDEARNLYAEFLPLLDLVTQSPGMEVAFEKTVLARLGWIASDQMRLAPPRPDAKHRADIFRHLEKLSKRFARE
jgi:4-hydroxy-tetrahydrodipicolinate synthase